MKRTNNTNNIMTEEQVERTLKTIRSERKKIADITMSCINKGLSTIDLADSYDSICNDILDSAARCILYSYSVTFVRDTFQQYWSDTERALFREHLENINRLKRHYGDVRRAREKQQLDLLFSVM